LARPNAIDAQIDGVFQFEDKMNKILLISLILVTTLGLGSACQKAGGSKWPATSEAADATPATSVKTGKLTLNAQPAGTLEDPNPLISKLKGIITYREGEGILRKNTNEIMKDVYVVADPKISISAIAKLGESGGDLWFPRGKGLPDTAALPKPNPLILVLKTENSPAEWFPAGLLTDDELAKLACMVRFETYKERTELILGRTHKSSIEIASDDSFFLNTELSPDLIKAENLKPDQRAVTESELSSVLGKLYEKRSYASSFDREQQGLTVIASENASYASLLKLLAAIDKPNVVVTVRIRPLTFVEKKEK
jgi:hypothetical protein